MNALRRSLFAVAVALLIPTFAMAATTEVRALLDLDNDATTGCTVGTLTGVDQILVTEVEDDGTTARVTEVHRLVCTGGIFGEPVDVDESGWPAGYEPESGTLLVETRIPFAALGGMPHDVRLGFDATRGAASVFAATTPGGEEIIYPAPRHRRRHAVGFPGEEREILLDGIGTDWGTIAPLVVGLPDDGTPSLRFIKIFGFANPLDSILYFRFDLHIGGGAPVALDDSYKRKEDQGLTVPPPGVLKNDTDPSGAPLTAVPVSTTGRGDLTLNPDGSFTYTPDNPGSLIGDTFEYKASNGSEESNVAEVKISVTEVNHPPVVDDQTMSVDENSANGTVVGTVVFTDEDVDDTHTFAILSGNGSGAFAINSSTGQITVANGSVLDFEVQAQYILNVNVTDSGSPGKSDTANITIDLNDVNDAPVATADSGSVNEDAPLNVAAPGVLANDSDEDSDPLTAVLVSGPSHAATFALNADGSYGYTPVADYFGADSFTYHANDGAVDSNTVTVSLTVNSVNDAPSFTAGADQTVDEDDPAQTVVGWATGISPGPANESGQTVAFVIDNNTNTALFSVQPSVAPDGTLTYTPAPDANGVATITLHLTDTGGTANGGADASGTQSFMITVNAVNDAPVVVAGHTHTYTENDPPLTLEPLLTITDVDSTTVQCVASNDCYAQISGNPDVNNEVLACPACAGLGITATWSAPSSLLSLTGAGTIADYQTAMRSVTYVGTSENPSQAQRDIDWFIKDSAGLQSANTLTANDTLVDVLSVNDEPSFTSGGDVLADSTPGTQVTFNGWATAISPGPGAESSQNVDFVIDNYTNPGLFTVGPAVDPAGNLTFTPVAGAQGTSTVTLHIHDDGGTANGGDDASPTQVFVITLDASPAVTSTSPTNGATDVVTSTNVTIDFNEPVNATGASFTISCTSSGAHTFALSGGPTSWTLDPDTDFTQAETCTVTVVAAQVTDADANDGPNNMLADYVLSFTMDAAPSVTSVTPVDLSTNIATNTDLTVDFSEAVTITNSSVTISCGSSGAHTVVVSGGPTSWTVNPNSDFATGEVCTVTVLAAQVSDNDGNDPPDNLGADYVFSFTTDAPPSVTATTPANGSTTNPATDITITFDEPVNVAGSWFTINCGTTGAHTAAVTGGPTVFTLNPDVDFAGGETCTVTVLAAQVDDQDSGDPPSSPVADYVFTFDVDAAPTVISTAPANGAPQAAANTDVTVDFSESVNASGTSFTISCNVSGVHAFSTSASPASSFTLDPTVDFSLGETCTVTVLAAQVTDDDANDPPDNMAADYVFSFTIDAAPSVSSTTPANGAVDQSASTSITVDFSEPVNAAGSWATVSCTTSGAHAVSLSGGPSSFTIDPTVDFTEGETCTVTVLAAQITDVDGFDPPDNMLADYVFSFSIDAAPTVTSTTPADTAVGIATTSDITLDFSESVSLTAAPVTINCATSGAHNTYGVSASPNTSFTIDPSVDFAPGELCTVVVLANQVSDSDANDPPDNMTADYTFTFTTDLAPDVDSTTPTNGGIGGPASDLTVTFTEPVDVAGSWFTISCGTSGAHTAVVTGGPTTWTLNPDTDFTAGETCNVSILAAQVTDQDAGDPPNNMVVNYDFSFTVDAPPSITATNPADTATDRPTSTTIQITYDEAVNATGSAYTIDCPAPGNLQAFTLGGNGTSVHTLTPTLNLPAGVTCTVTVLASEITDVDANDPPDNMAGDYVFTFSTDAPPSVTSTTPADTATGVTTDANITLDFSESVSLTASAVTISCATSGAHTDVISASPNTTFTVNPNTDFVPNELCTVTVVANQVSDTDANDPPDNMAANYVFSFTTDAQPSVTATTPADTAVDVTTNANISLTFSESVSLTASAVTISCATSGVHTNVISASPNTNFTVDPDADFVGGELCTVTVVANQVSDTDANDPPNNMAADYVFGFTTDAAPSVSSTTPANSATGVSPSTNIDITFSEPVNVAGNWFQIVCGAQTKNPGDTAITGGPTTFTINPTTNLLAGEVCNVTVFAAQIADQDGNDPPDNMTADYTFSFSVPPEAVDDTYGNAILGNVSMNTDNSTEFSILTNDIPSTGVTINTSGTTLQGGTIVMAADGKFSYNPPAGYEGADSFTYTITNAAGTSASATVNLTVTGMVWFINNAAGAGDGRLATPFNSVGSFAALNDGVGNHPAANDVIFVYESGVAYAGNLTLLNGQRLIGQDHTTGTIASLGGVTLGPDNTALPAMSAAAPITDYTGSLTLGQNNQLHGFSHFPSAVDAISGTNFGTLTVSEVFLNNSAGRALNLNTGTLSANFGGIVSTNSGTNGVTLTSVNGSLTIGNSGTSSNSTGSLVAISGGNVGITWGNNLSQANNAALLDISGGHTGTINFNGIITATNGTGLQFNNADGTYNFNGTTQSLNGGDAGVDITNASAGSFTFSNFFLIGNTTSPSGTAFNVNGSTAGVTYSGSITQSNNASLLTVTDHSAGTITFQTGTLGATNGNGLQFTNADGTYNFNGTTTLNGGDAGIDVLFGTDVTNGSQGTFSFNSGSSITNPSGPTIGIQGNKPTFTYSGSFSKSSSGVGINVLNNQGGSITINGTGTKSLSTGASSGIFLDNNDNCTIAFSGNNLSLTTSSGAAFTATGGGTVTVTGTGNTISTSSGAGVNVANTTIGGGGITFQSLNHNGNNTAITLTSTGAGFFTVSGTGATGGSGGTIQNTVGADAITLNTTGGLVTLKNMIIQDITASTDGSDLEDTHSNVDAIHGLNVNAGLTLDNVTIQRISDNGINGSVNGAPPTSTVWNGLTLTNCTFTNTNRFNTSHADANNESAVHILGIKGTVSVTGSSFSNAGSGLRLWSDTSGTLDVTIQSNSFTTLYKEIGTLSVGLYGIDIRQFGTLTSTVRIGDTTTESNAALGNTFTNGGDRASIDIIADVGTTGAMKTSIAKNTFTVTDHSSPGVAPGGTSYNFPQGGVLFRARGTGNFEAIFAANVLNQVMHADGGIGQLTMIAEKGDSEFIVRNNTFQLPWDAPIELRADGQDTGQNSAKVFFTGNTYVDGTVGDGTTDLGGPSPYQALYVQTRNNGRMDLTMQNENPFGLTDTSSATGSYSLYALTTTAGDIFNLFLQNTQAPRGYRLLSAASTTYNLYRNGSVSGTAQGVLQDNGNTGGGGVDGTVPPATTTSGTVNLSAVAPSLPNITPP